MAEDSDRHSSTVVVALPSANDPTRDFGDEEKHLTLLFFEHALDDDAVSALAELVGHIASRPTFPTPVSLPILGTKALGDEGAQVWLVSDVDEVLQSVRHDVLLNESFREAWESVDQFPKFTPHVTIAYDELPEEAKALSSVTLDRLAVWNGDTRMEFPWTGKVDSVLFGGR